MKLNLGCGPERLEGFVNRDPVVDGWRFEHGLRDYADGSVDAIRISCAMYFLDPEPQWAFLKECARVLAPRGVIRVTEPDLKRNIERGLREAFGEVYEMEPDTTFWHDRSLESGHPEDRTFIYECVKQ